MSKIKILIVEDDPNLGKILFEYLDAKNFDISLAIDGEEGLEKFLNNTWDLLLLDVMMPKKDGFSLAKDIRKVDQDIPIIFLTAKSQKDNIIKAFVCLADRQKIKKALSVVRYVCLTSIYNYAFIANLLRYYIK